MSIELGLEREMEEGSIEGGLTKEGEKGTVD